MTAVFKKPLSEMRNPFSVSFSSRSPCFRGAAICLNAVAGTVLFVILYSPHHGAQNIAKNLSQMNGSQLVRNDVRNVVHLACAVVPHCQRLARRAVCSHFSSVRRSLKCVCSKKLWQNERSGRHSCSYSRDSLGLGSCITESHVRDASSSVDASMSPTLPARTRRLPNRETRRETRP